MAYKPFKMKGHALPGIHQNPEGNTDLPDGRSGSSPLQQKKWSDMSDKEKTDLFKVTHRKPENLIEKQKRRMKETQIFSPEQQEKRERASFSKKLHKDIMKAIGKQLKKSPAKKVDKKTKLITNVKKGTEKKVVREGGRRTVTKTKDGVTTTKSRRTFKGWLTGKGKKKKEESPAKIYDKSGKRRKNYKY